jgi:non-heme chloroperoxidase
MTVSVKGAHDCVKQFSETDFTEDLKKMEFPVLLLHGDGDQIVPIKASAKKVIKLLPQGTLKIYPSGPHALPNILPDEVNKDILEFIEA